MGKSKFRAGRKCRLEPVGDRRAWKRVICFRVGSGISENAYLPLSRDDRRDDTSIKLQNVKLP